MRRIGYNISTMRRKIFTFLIAIAICVVPLISIVGQVFAQSVSAADLINWMNGLRMANGYSPMIEDALLDQSAASAAYAMYDLYAGTYTCGHPGGKMERIAATGYGGGDTFFATENIACATSADLSWFAQYNVWGDPEHQYPATQSQYTRVGAFAYEAPNGVTYYVMHAASGDGDSSGGSVNTGGTVPEVNEFSGTDFVVAYPTSTPDMDGTIYHKVLYYDTLYSIAVNYGVTIGQIKTLNGLTGDDIYAGDTLKISIKPTATVTSTRTPTVKAPTRTPTNTPMPTTPRPTRTATPTLNPNVGDLFPKIDRQWIGLGLLIFSAVGFFVVFYFLFLKAKPKQ